MSQIDPHPDQRSERRTYNETVRTEHGIEPVWPTEYWFCTNIKCGEPSGSDPCQFCGEPVTRYRVILAEES